MLTRMLLTLYEGRSDAMIITTGVTTRRLVHQLTQILHISLNPIRSYPISFVFSNRGNSRFSILLLPQALPARIVNRIPSLFRCCIPRSAVGVYEQ